MPKNKLKGGKNVKRGKNQKFEEARELVFKEDGQEYVACACICFDCAIKISSARLARLT